MGAKENGHAVTAAMRLEEINPDPRGNERVFRLVIENLSPGYLSLVYLSPLLPKDVEFREVMKPASFQVKKEYESVCRDLTLILNDEMLFSSKSLIENRKKIATNIVNEVLGGDLNSISGIIRWYVKLITTPFIRRIISSQFQDIYHATHVVINSYDQAKSLFEYFTTQESADRNFIKVFEIKLGQLRKLEDECQKIPEEKPTLIQIEPGRMYSEQYIFRFPTNWISTKKYNLILEAVFLTERQKEQKVRASASVNIVPNGIVLSLLAVIFGVSGVLFKEVVFQQVGLESFLESFPLSDALTGSLLAFIIFNIYEYLGLANASKMEISWRSAAFFGFSCGLLQKNLFYAIKAFLGLP